MKPQDLRIGNWVCLMYKDTNNVQDYIKIESNHIHLFNKMDLEPIPLTEQWLLDFGFYKIKEKNTFLTLQNVIEEFSLFFNLKTSCIELETDYCQVIQLKRLKYIHQLQNLFHALTGQELTLNK